MSLALRWLIPFATGEFAERVQFDLSPYHPLFVSHVLIQLTPIITGMIAGFLLLESKESQVVNALRVTPVTLTGHILVLGSAVVAVTIPLILVEGLLIGAALPSLPALAAMSAAAAPASVAIALFIAAMASSKTEAIVYSKFVGLAPLLASISWFLPEPWQYIAGIYPPYWASKAYWLALDGVQLWWVAALVGLLLSGGWLALMAKLLIHRLQS